MTGQAVQVRVHSVAHGGAGVGRATAPEADTRTWLVRGALPGELVEAGLDHAARRHLRGHALRVIETSDSRVDPPCTYATTCGGCAWQHVSPRAQAEYKRQIVVDQLRGLVDGIEIPPTVTGTQHLGYRRTARMHYRTAGGALQLGFYGAADRDVVDVESCPVLRPEVDHAFARLRRLDAAVLPPAGEAHAVSNGEVAVLGLPGVRPSPELDAALRQLLDDVLVGVVARGGRNRLVVGRSALDIDAFDGLPPTRMGPFSFSQAQAEVNRDLVRHVAAAARASGRKVLELFAGSGNLTRSLARVAQRVWAVDGDRESVDSLRELAKRTGLPINAKKGNAEGLLARLAADQKRYDVVVLDPPRSGLGKAAAADLARVAQGRIVYVSCDPATLARDLKVLLQGGCRLDDVRVFDLMPMTPHVEIVATLVSTGGGRA